VGPLENLPVTKIDPIAANEMSVSKSYFAGFSRVQLVLFWLCVAVGLALRWIGLDERPFHHDESLHGMYGKYFFDWPEHNYYKYSPMLHGPFLYNMLRVVYNTLGESDWAARAPIALVGSALLFVPLLFRRWLSVGSVLVLTATVSLSPTLVYWSRFLREDTLILALMALMLFAVTEMRAPLKAFWFILAFTLQFCIKENAYVTLAILLGYLVFEHLYALWKLDDKNSLVRSMFRYVSQHKVATFVACAVSTFIYCYLYSAGFRYSQGILDGLYRESIVYWMHHHNIERISGPFLFHFYMLSWYESLFVLAFLAHLYFFYRAASMPVRALAAATLIFALTLGIWVSTNMGVGVQATGSFLDPTSINFLVWKFFKLKDGYDLVGLIIFLVHPFIVTVVHLNRGERALAFFGYFFTATLFTYSYLGEKVPWLSVYPFVSGLAYFALFFESVLAKFDVGYWSECSTAALLRNFGILCSLLGLWFLVESGEVAELWWVFSGLVFVFAANAAQSAGMLGSYNAARFGFAVLALFMLRASVLTNFVYAGDAREYISQVHTTKEFHTIMKALQTEINSELRGYRPSVFVTGEATWPSTWYMRHYPNEYKFTAATADYPSFNYLVLDWKEGERPAGIPEHFRVLKINLRGWWVPDFREMTLKRFLAYALNRTPWGPTGYSYVNLVVNPAK
jgi:uncharacterized protein (TIGR03663 family)